ncbi:MAG: dihydrofolate reductase [Methylophilaceae bacterium]
MSCISLIAAVALHRVIGVNNTLPWHLPEDLKRFRALTTGHHIIMGRKTYESLNRLLPGRTTVIVSRNHALNVPGALIANSLQQALALCGADEEVFIIGGAELYRDGLKLADKLYITEIDAAFAGDAFFPEIDFSVWRQSTISADMRAGEINYRYVLYQRQPQTTLNAISRAGDIC